LLLESETTMEFKKLDIATIPVVRSFLKYSNTNTCDYTVGGIYMWRKFFNMQYTIVNGAYYSRLFDSYGNEFYNLPLSVNIEESLIYLVDELRKSKNEINFCTIPESFIPIFEKNFTVKSLQEQPEYFDYLYATDDLVSLRGKKYRSQRNLISQFERTSGNWCLKEVHKDDIPSIRKFFLENCTEKQDDPTAIEEQLMVLEVLDHFESYGMLGGYLSVDDTIVGFSLGELLNDTFFVHIEKASRSVKGAFQMLAYQIAQNFVKGKASFINREEDMGDPGLKKAKEAYHPIEMLKKYTIEV